MSKLLAFFILMLAVTGIFPLSCQAQGFVAATPPPANADHSAPESLESEKAHWLAFSALYEVLDHNRVDGYDQLFCQTCRSEAFAQRMSLQRSWGITDRDTAIIRINRFFGPLRMSSYEQAYQDYLLDKASADKELLSKIDTAQFFLAQFLNFGDADFYRIKTLAGWDYMRCANITKISYNLGYITEEEAWFYLRENAAMAEAAFDTWEDYFISFMLGRVISYRTEGTDRYVLSAKRLFNDPYCEWYNSAIRP